MVMASAARTALLSVALGFASLGWAIPARSDEALLRVADLCLMERSNLDVAASRIEGLGFSRWEGPTGEFARYVGLSRMAAHRGDAIADPRRQLEQDAAMAEHELRLRPGRFGSGTVILSAIEGGSLLILWGSLSVSPLSCQIFLTDGADLDDLLEALAIELQEGRTEAFRFHYRDVGPLHREPRNTLRDLRAFSVDRRILAAQGIETDLVGGLAIRRD